MKRSLVWLAILVMLGSAAAFARVKPMQVMPRLVDNARFVYVTSYDGPFWSANVLPADRQAVADVQNALKKWGKYIVVYEPGKADLILAVQRRGGEDVLALYQPGLSSPLWRGMSENGLDPQEMPLFADFRNAVEQTAARK